MNSVVVNDPDFSWWWSRGQDTVIYTTSLTKAWKIRVISTFRIADNYSCQFKVFAWGTQIMSQSVNQKNVDYFINLLSENEYAAGTQIQIKVYESANQMLVKWMYIESVVARDFEYDHMGYPADVKEIWEQTSINIYWVHDWIFRGWIIRQTTSTATTWAITLWNAVWFLEINFNWQIVKVPYYT